MMPTYDPTAEKVDPGLMAQEVCQSIGSPLVSGDSIRQLFDATDGTTTGKRKIPSEVSSHALMNNHTREKGLGYSTLRKKVPHIGKSTPKPPDRMLEATVVDVSQAQELRSKDIISSNAHSGSIFNFPASKRSFMSLWAALVLAGLCSIWASFFAKVSTRTSMFVLKEARPP